MQGFLRGTLPLWRILLVHPVSHEESDENDMKLTSK